MTSRRQVNTRLSVGLQSSPCPSLSRHLSRVHSRQFFERAYPKLLGEDMVENEDSLSVGLMDDSLQQEVHVLVNLHIRHVNVPLNLLQA